MLKVNGKTVATGPAAELVIYSNGLFRTWETESGCPVWPTYVKEGDGFLVRWMDASGSVRAQARI